MPATAVPVPQQAKCLRPDQDVATTTIDCQATTTGGVRGLDASRKGAFVGGDLLVHTLTYWPAGLDEELYGNFASSSRLPPR